MVQRLEAEPDSAAATAPDTPGAGMVVWDTSPQPVTSMPPRPASAQLAPPGRHRSSEPVRRTPTLPASALPQRPGRSDPTQHVPTQPRTRGAARPATRRQHRRQARRRSWTGRTITALSAVLVLFALLAPNQLSRLSPAVFLRIPVEGLAGVAAVLVLPVRVRRPLTGTFGVVLGVLTIGKFLDMGFFTALYRPFDVVFDWAFVGNGVEFLTMTVGRTGAIAVEVGVVLLAVTIVALMTLSVLRLSHLVVRSPRPSAAGCGLLTVVWVLSAALGLQAAPGEAFAAKETFNAALDRVHQVGAAQQDQQAFTAQLVADSIHTTPGSQLLTGLRGKDVIVAFVESYGRDALEDPQFASGVGAVLTDGYRRLQAAGMSARSGWLTSPTFGGGSWLAQSTLLSGVWANNQQRYNQLVSSNHLTLNRAFHRAGWRTVGIVPGVTRAWPESVYFGFDRFYDSRHLGYVGPKFGWSQVPDQFSLAAFQRLERSRRNRRPIMAEIPLTSSHIPWSPLPRVVDWAALGDGSGYAPMAVTGETTQTMLQNSGKARAAYVQSIEYSLNSLISYLERYGGDNLVMVFLGDHQPSSIVTGQGASHDVPISIVAKDPKVLDRVSGWGWQVGLQPGPGAPVWRMDSFRDRFLAAFGPQPAAP
ncbi:MAG TPA: sulfatase-like hydrolase/transferase [Kineosporiaceae bacterium]